MHIKLAVEKQVLLMMYEMKKKRRTGKEMGERDEKSARKFIGSGICFDNNLLLLLWFW